MENGKKAKNSLTIVVVVLSILLVVTLCSTAYFYFKASRNSTEGDNNKETVVTDKENKNNNSEKLVVENGFDNSKSLNTNGKTYTLTGGNSNIGMTLSFDSTKKRMTVYISACRFEHTYNVGWVTINEETCAAEGGKQFEQRGEISFEQEVSDFMIGGFGQDATNDTMLFLMKDGTIEYVPIKKGYTGISPDKVKSFGKIKEVKDVIKLYQVSAGSYTTVLAQKADGSFYDLNESLSSMSAWS